MNFLRLLKVKLTANSNKYDLVVDDNEVQEVQEVQTEKLATNNANQPASKSSHKNVRAQSHSKKKASGSLAASNHPPNIVSYEQDKFLDTKSDPNTRLKRPAYQLRQLRRQIRDDFLPLLDKGNECDTEEIVKFLTKYNKEQDLMREILSQYKTFRLYPSVMVWNYLDGNVSSDFLMKVSQQQIIDDFKASVQQKLPDPIILPVKIGSKGPRIDIINQESVVEYIMQLLPSNHDSLKLEGDLDITVVRDYEIKIAFVQGFSIKRTLRLELERGKLPSDCLEELKDIQPLQISASSNTLSFFEEYLGDIGRENIIEYYSRLGKVLATAYHEGYWETTEVQRMLSDWRSIRNEFFLDLQDGNSDASYRSLLLFTDLSKMPIVPEAQMQCHNSMELVRQELLQVQAGKLTFERVPAKLDLLIAEAKQYSKQSNHEQAQRFIDLTQAYAKTGTGTLNLQRYSLAQYCKARGSSAERASDKRIAQSYYLCLIFLHGQIYNSLPSHYRERLENDYRSSLATYFRIHGFELKLNCETQEKAKNSFYEELIRVLNQKTRASFSQSLGSCLIDIAIVDEPFISDFINRLKQKERQWSQVLGNMAMSLSHRQVFMRDPELCLRLLRRIDSNQIGAVLSNQNLGTLTERRLVSIALLRFANMYKEEPEEYFQAFDKNSSLKRKKDLAFSILVEPFILNSDKESLLKAQLIAAILGLVPGTRSYNYFLDKVSSLADDYNKFTSSTDPDIKGRYGYNILNKIRLSRRFLIEDLTKEKTELALQFFRSIEAYVTAEQNKLIRDTTLEVELITERVLHSQQETRLTLEIRNVGAGLAENIRIYINRVSDQYQVEERYCKYEISILRDRELRQQDIFIQPLVEPNQYITLSAIVVYDTPREQDKIAQIPLKNRQVLLYPDTQFFRIPQPYNIGQPATTWFYGRHEMLESMADNLRSDGDMDVSMIVYGLKRAGKTSVVLRFAEHMLRQRNLEDHYLWLYVNLEKEPLTKQMQSDGDFLALLLSVIQRILPEEAHLNIDTANSSHEFVYNPFERFNRLLNHALETIYPRKLLIILDEFSYLNHLLKEKEGGRVVSDQVFSFLSNVIQHTNQLTFVFTGTYVLLEMMRENAFDLAKICTPTLVSFLDETSARRLIIEPVQQDEQVPSKGWLKYDPRVIERIISITACHPYLIQYLCMHLVNRMNAIKYSIVNLKDLDLVVNEIISRPEHEPAILILWREFDVPQHKLLTIIAENSEPETGIDFADIVQIYKNLDDNTPPENIREICLSLVDADLIERSTIGDTSLYRIRIPLYEMWIKNNRNIKTIFGK